MNNKQILLVVLCSISLIAICTLYLANKRENEPNILQPPIDEKTEAEKDKKETAVFDTFNRLTPADTSFILFKEAPSFLFIGDFETDEGHEMAKSVEKLNKKYGFSNMAYVLDMQSNDFELDENGEIEFGDISLPNKMSILMIFEGKAVSIYECVGKTYEQMDEYMSQFYELNEENNVEEQTYGTK